MAEKKPTTRVKKSARGKRPMSLTSAIGPKATTMVVILVMAGGIMVAARQQQARAKEALAGAARADVVMTPEPGTKKAAASTAPSASAAPLTAATSVTVTAKAPTVTVTGCLEEHDNAFRLKDTSGAEAPKSRSWKSGFLKKGAASVNVVDAAKGLNLASHVGRRVSVTGTLDGRDMSARSMRPLGSCKAAN
jgi:hypothetical protein